MFKLAYTVFKMSSNGLAIFLLVLANGFSVYRACQVPYSKVACYKDLQSPRMFPTLLYNARHDYAENNPGYSIEWDVTKYGEFLTRFICDCAKAAAPNNYFSIQFYGECWTGTAGPEEFSKYGMSDDCVNSSFTSCQPSSMLCSGAKWSNMVYYIPPVEATDLSTTSRSPPTTTQPPLTTTQAPPTITQAPTTTIQAPTTTQPPPTTTQPPPTTTQPPPTTTQRPPTTTQPPPTTTQPPLTTTQPPPTTTQPPLTTTQPPPTTTQPPPTTTQAPPTTAEPPTSTSVTEPATQKPGCAPTKDILIAMDVSSSVIYEGLMKLKDLLGMFVAEFPVNENEVHFALIHYNYYVYTDFTFNDLAFHNVHAVQNAINNVPLLGGATLTQAALNKALKMFSQDGYGARQVSNKVLVVVTDGYTYGGAETLKLPSDELELYGVQVIPVGIGTKTNPEGLKTMSPNVLTLGDLVNKSELELLQYSDMLADIVCNTNN